MEKPNIILVSIIKKNTDIEYKYKKYYVYNKIFVDSDDISSLWIAKPPGDDGYSSYIYLKDTTYNKVIRKIKLDKLDTN